MTATPIIRSYEAKVDDVKTAERAVISRIGGMDVDRHRTIISHRGIDLSSYQRNPIVLHEHGKCPTRGSLPVGKNQWIKIDGDKMIAKTIFRDDPYSIELFNAYRDDWMRGWSINVLSHDASPPTDEEMRAAPNLRDDCDLIYRHTELVEYSTTSAPSHRDALTILVERGIWVPDEAKAEVEKFAGRTTVLMPGGSPPAVATDCSEGMAVQPSSPGAPAKPVPKVKDDEEGDEDGEDKDGTHEGKRKRRDTDEVVTITRHIVKEDGKFFVYSEDGSKKLGGPYATREEADKRLGQIEYFKHEDGERSAPVPTTDPSAPIQHDGHGGWTAIGLDGVTFPTRAVAEQARALMASPPRFDTEWSAIQREIRERSERSLAFILDEIDLQRNGRV